MLPTHLSNLYGECPFAGMPELTRPRVKKRVAAVSFEGTMADKGLSRSGLIVLRRIEENGVLSWRVRQVYWYRELPSDAKLSEKSATRADREQEPAVLRAADSFVRAWKTGDYERMDEMTFHWWERDRDPPKWIKMKHVTLTRHPTALDGIRVGFDAKLKVIGILTRHVKGDLWLVEEDGHWRVRPLTFSFAF
jgi:hypothetical protein